MDSRFWRYGTIWILIIALAWIGERTLRGALFSETQPRLVAPRNDLAESEKSTIALFEQTAPSVVYIFTRVDAPISGFGSSSGRTGAGSGFVWDLAGHVVTNFHVVEGASRVGVKLDSGRTASASVVGLSPDHDLAVIRIDDARERLKPIPVGASGDLKVGQTVFAIGNPFGLDRTLTTGIISALNRRLPTASGREIAGVIQTDAAINPGNSGGPLLDSSGRLIGVNTAIISDSGQFAGIGFAVPVDVVNRVVPQLIRDGRVPRPGIGIVVAPEEVNARLGIEGVIVARVAPGTPAHRAGLRGLDPQAGRIGDVIVAVDGRTVRTLADVAAEFERAGIGRDVEIGILREARRETLRVQVIDLNAP